MLMSFISTITRNSAHLHLCTSSARRMNGHVFLYHNYSTLDSILALGCSKERIRAAVVVLDRSNFGTDAVDT